MKRYFTYEGRMNRGRYAICVFLTILLSLSLSFLSSHFSAPALNNILKIFFIPVAIGSNILNFFWIIQRLHDLGKSGKHLAWGFIPVLGLLIFVPLIFIKGSHGPNKYGPDPLDAEYQAASGSIVYNDIHEECDR